MAAAGADPRPEIASAVRPVVARGGSGVPGWAMVALVAVIGIALFVLLDARRQRMLAPSTRERAADDAEAPPAIAPLFIPPVPQPPPVPPAMPIAPPTPRPALLPTPDIRATPPAYGPVPAPAIPVTPPAAPPPRATRTGNDPVLVIDTPASGSGETATAAASDSAKGRADGTSTGAERVRAAMFRNRATTVVEGTLVPAVLESALDSTRPGPARALVTQDVRGFDGSRVLIQRGSKLIGEYKADLQPGQNRALVIWTRLIRPDGATIDLASPSADTLGRVGIRGQVNSHFLERFASAFLQSAVAIGTGIAARRAGGDSIAVLALPGTLGGTVTPSLTENRIQRTLRVRQGVSISVFVARDLDFTAVEGGMR